MNYKCAFRGSCTVQGAQIIIIAMKSTLIGFFLISILLCQTGCSAPRHRLEITGNQDVDAKILEHLSVQGDLPSLRLVNHACHDSVEDYARIQEIGSRYNTGASFAEAGFFEDPKAAAVKMIAECSNTKLKRRFVNELLGNNPADLLQVGSKKAPSHPFMHASSVDELEKNKFVDRVWASGPQPDVLILINWLRNAPSGLFLHPQRDFNLMVSGVLNTWLRQHKKLDYKSIIEILEALLVIRETYSQDLVGPCPTISFSAIEQRLIDHYRYSKDDGSAHTLNERARVVARSLNCSGGGLDACTEMRQHLR